MTKVLVVYGSRHGATRGIAVRIGEVLREDGLEAEVAAAATTLTSAIRTRSSSGAASTSGAGSRSRSTS